MAPRVTTGPQTFFVTTLFELFATLVATRCHFAVRLLPDLHFGRFLIISASLFNISYVFLDLSVMKRYHQPDWYRQLRETMPVSSQPSLVSSPVPMDGQLGFQILLGSPF